VEFDRQAEAFEALGYRLAALSVDVPERLRAARARIGLRMPLLCDVTREAVKGWDLYNRRERGGIAVPATVVIGADGAIRFCVREGMARRLRASELLAWLAQPWPQQPWREQPGAVPGPRGYWPGWRAWWRALRR